MLSNSLLIPHLEGLYFFLKMWFDKGADLNILRWKVNPMITSEVIKQDKVVMIAICTFDFLEDHQSCVRYQKHQTVQVNSWKAGISVSQADTRIIRLS